MNLNDIIKLNKEKKAKKFFNNLEESLKNSYPEFKFPEKFEISNIDLLLEKINNFPTSFSVDNLEELSKYIKIPENKFPSSFKVENPEDIAKHIKFKQEKFPSEFKVSNLGEIKFEKTEIPGNLKDLSFKKTESFLKDIYDKFSITLNAVKNGIFIANSKPSESIPVRMVTKDGKEFTEFKHNVIGMPTVVGSKNIDNIQINPATEETLQSIAGFNIPPFDTFEVTYTDATQEDISSIDYFKDTVLVKTITATQLETNKVRYSIL